MNAPSGSGYYRSSEPRAYAGAAIVIWGVSATLIRFAYRFPGALEAAMARFLCVGGL